MTPRAGGGSLAGTMDFGINLATSSDSWKVVKRAEELGYARAWFYDTQMLNADMFVAMGAAAVQTSRIRLGTGVLIPSNRIAPVAASALASLNALAPGRIDFGISTGFTARRTMGLRPVKLSDMEEYIRIVQAILAGETLEWTFEGLAAQDPLSQRRARRRQSSRSDPAVHLGDGAQESSADRAPARELDQRDRQHERGSKLRSRDAEGVARRRHRSGFLRGYRIRGRLRVTGG